MASVLDENTISNEEALARTVHNGARIASGFATSEPHTFYATIWDHIRRHNVVDLTIRQALFMAPHRLCLGDALSARGRFRFTRKLDGLRKLVAHYDELRARRIVFDSAFIGAATNAVIPRNLLTRILCGRYVDRNTTRAGITDMHAVHFPDGLETLVLAQDGSPSIDTFVAVVTPPDANGEMSMGPANGANTDALELTFKLKTIQLLLYINPNYPFTRGHGDAPNTVHVGALEALARAGKLLVVRDEGKIPAFPAGTFSQPSRQEQAIAANVANHIEVNRSSTYGRALQVGIGGTGALAIKALKDSSWTGRGYSEMLEPFTLDLLDAGRIKGSHIIERDGRRTELDGKFVCTFACGVEGDGFYKRLHNHPAVVLATASRVVIPEGFYYGLGINSCLGIDFHGHVNSGGRDRNYYSGIGGGAMIMRGLARGGIAYFCLKSVHTTPEGKLRSSIFPFMPRGTPIGHVGPDIMGGREGAKCFLVTEHGVAQLNRSTQANFIRSLISVADPRFRPWLKSQAWREFRVCA